MFCFLKHRRSSSSKGRKRWSEQEEEEELEVDEEEEVGRTGAVGEVGLFEREAEI